jgi:HEPN domain-containing protein
VFSPSPEQIDNATILLRRAEGDLEACRVLADNTNIDDNVVGFHAQQAVEKALKVALVLADSELPRTHDIELLVDRVRTRGTNWRTSQSATGRLLRSCIRPTS